MCGIAGILDWQGAPADRLDLMLKSITHRGPDDEGTFVEGPIAMGMRRLAVIDLQSGQQPIFNEDESVVVVFNGEIFNYLELRADLEQRGHKFRTHSDTEVLVHLYEEEGLDFLPRLNGMFGFTIWDRQRRRLFMVRDRVGIKPLYYKETDRGLLYGTELKSILTGDVVNQSLNPSAIVDYLTHFYIPGTQSPYQGINKLLPGHYLVADEHGVAIHRWWDLGNYASRSNISREDASERIRELFLDSIRLRMRSDVPVGSYLSGGLDSSLISAAAAAQTNLDFATFSVGFSDSEFNELPYARAVAEHIGSNHHEIQVSPSDALEHLPNLIWHMDEPNGDAAILPTYLVSELAARHVTVALSGIGADEFFGGYPRYHRQLEKLGQLAILPTGLLRVIRPLLAALRYDWGYRLDRIIAPPKPWIGHLEQTHRYDEASIKRLMGADISKLGGYTRSSFERYPGTDYVNQRMFVDAHGYLPDQILAITDRMSMAVSLEARAPFLDYRLMEFATSLPGEWKVDGREWKIILKRALGDLVPQTTIKRPKWGFAPPVRSWMSSKHLDAFVHILRNSQMARDGYLDGAELKRQMTGPGAFQNKGEWLWALAVLELWYRVSISGGTMARPDVSLHEFAHAD